MICRAKGCKNIAIDGETLCGWHDELAEDGEPITMKRPPRKRPRSAEYLERESRKKAEKWAEIKAEWA